MIDISSYKVPQKVQDVVVKLNQYINVMESMGKHTFKVILFNDDYEVLNRFAKEVTGNKYTLGDVTWRGHKVTKSGSTR